MKFWWLAGIASFVAGSFLFGADSFLTDDNAIDAYLAAYEEACRSKTGRSGETGAGFEVLAGDFVGLAIKRIMLNEQAALNEMRVLEKLGLLKDVFKVSYRNTKTKKMEPSWYVVMRIVNGKDLFELEKDYSFLSAFIGAAPMLAQATAKAYLQLINHGEIPLDPNNHNTLFIPGGRAITIDHEWTYEFATSAKVTAPADAINEIAPELIEEAEEEQEKLTIDLGKIGDDKELASKALAYSLGANLIVLVCQSINAALPDYKSHMHPLELIDLLESAVAGLQGPMSPEHHQFYKGSPRDLQRAPSDKEKLRRFVELGGVDFLAGCLQKNPGNRFTLEKALAHSFITDNFPDESDDLFTADFWKVLGQYAKMPPSLSLPPHALSVSPMPPLSIRSISTSSNLSLGDCR